ncbi:DUF378 domain-containing protein [Lederbergia galactosidilytica]|uniref:DUF378 domain-containing protein n=1 Tax=Lederbergia galactosidilytica TaxID=217031 RepID=A0A0Q9Y8G0_9BACI|nr:DUF378 domain-containing protein [Lederbergia galactosidilytica]KRG07981.1 hypothetical protein ACA30_22805 [Virgibacillus soli]KRG17094.1 hypothetical protein ACA29_00700 [Lederbergia galactosidilytica]MBP1915211.1 uncharacterized membrane protein YuzA (DUF378 family) [Lederbergia galactosidilytica]OAK75450.1 hypothetical protein ABB05_01700 [Lederbergia galactosidilytica]
MRTLKRIALALVIIGAINWGLIGLFQFDLVASIFGGQTAGLSRFVYTLVGLAGLGSIAYFFEEDVVEDQDSVFRNSDFATEFAEEPDVDRLYNPSLEAYENEDEEEF